MITIVLPTFNGSRYLSESIQSILSQSHKEFELIIVDDASTDKTPELIKEFELKDARVRAVRNHQNLRLPVSLNRGFGLSRGDYFTWTSDDNRYHPNALERMLQVLKANPQIEGVYSNYQIIDEKSQPTGETVEVKTREHLWEGNCVGACFLYKKNVHEELGGYQADLFLAEDYDFWLRALSKFNFEPLHETLYDYRTHSESLTEKQKEKTKKAAHQALVLNYTALRSWLPKPLRIELALKLAKTCVELGQPVESTKFIADLVKTDPLTSAFQAAKKLGRFIDRIKNKK